jgi:hypothetical protein
MKSLKTKKDSTVVRAVAASTLLVPLAAFAAGMNLGNHNESIVS